MPTRSGARQRPRAATWGMTLRQRYEDVGLPWRKTIGSPLPASTWASSVSRTRILRRGRGSAGETGMRRSFRPRHSRIGATIRSLIEHDAAVDDDHLARDEVRHRGGQVDHRLGDIVGVPYA